jgi:hypothetical protein
MNMSNKNFAWLMMGVTAVFMVILTIVYYAPMWKDDYLAPSPQAEVHWLSEWEPGLKRTLGDTRVFIYDSGVPGANVLLLGGTHPDEPGAWVATVLMVERVHVSEGKLYVIPQLSNSSFSHNYPQEAHANSITFTLPDGSTRKFRHGARGANFADHWPDPEVFVQWPWRSKLAGEEIRNTNRAYPGRPNGTFVQRVANAVRVLVVDEKIDLMLDTHEAPPEYPFVNAISAHERGADIASFVQLYMQAEGEDIGLEVAPPQFRGLSNLEMGDAVPTVFAFITESVCLNMGKVRGITDESLIIDGRDAFYEAVSDHIPNLKAPFTGKDGWPLKRRVARNLLAFQMLVQTFAEFEGKSLVYEGLPTFAELMQNGVAPYLTPPPPGGQPDMGFRAYPGIWRAFFGSDTYTD